MKQRGIVRLDGTYDDITFYSSQGQHLARKRGGISRDRMLNDPAFERQRANFNEFGASAQVAAAIRFALLSQLRATNDKKGNQLLTAELHKLVKLGTGIRGFRTFELVANKHLLTGFEFKNKDPLHSLFIAPFSVSSTAARNEATLTVPDFDTSVGLKAPVGATHFRLVLSVGAVSDYAWDHDLGYVPLNMAENKLGAVAMSAPIPIGGMVGAATTVNAQLPGSPAIAANTALMAAVGVQFIEQIGSVDYTLVEGRCLRLADIF